MNRETQSHFATIPSMDISRSKFDRSFVHKTTCNTGELVPIYVDPDIVPGDTVTMKMSDLIRMTTPITPVMDDLKADFFFFFVPNRLVWNQFKNFMGENDTAPWIQTTNYTIPQLQIDNITSSNDVLQSTIQKGSVLDHMGIPTNYTWKHGVDTVTDPDKQETTKRKIFISALPVRAYCLIWNEFFRSEALQNPVTIGKSYGTVGVYNTNFSGWVSDPDAFQVQYAARGGLPCLKVCKTFDYFTACLPRPQAGNDVTLPMNGTAPIKIGQQYDTVSGKFKDITGVTDKELIFSVTNGDEYNGYIDSENPYVFGSFSANETAIKLYSDLNQATGATINQLRTAFAIQKWQEREARGGQRYTEMVRSHFNTINPDFRLQRPEYLGGFTHQISMNQVLSQGNDTSGAPIGTTGAYSLSTNKNGDVFSHSFTEHGILLGLMCIRQNQHTYQQGINRAWLKKERFDFYTPEFANLGETYVELDEIYAQGTNEDKDAFGYQERWAEMRYMPDLVSGEMRSDYTTSLDIWHYADYYTSKPELGNKWIQEGTENVNRTLAIQNQDQFKVDLYFGAIYTRPLPVYSVPGLLDHH